MLLLDKTRKLVDGCVPRKPLPPHTTSFFFAAVAEAIDALNYNWVTAVWRFAELMLHESRVRGWCWLVRAWSVRLCWKLE